MTRHTEWKVEPNVKEQAAPENDDTSIVRLWISPKVVTGTEQKRKTN